MNFVTATCTDIGIKKKTNQDSMLIQQAQTPYGNVLFAAVCDGMGGLSKGEVASATAVEGLRDWFQRVFPGIMDAQINEDVLFASLRDRIQDVADVIGDYGTKIGVDLGTTIVTLLIVNGKFYVANVGDSRVYRIAYMVEQITHDQTVVQREIDLGHITPEEAEVDPRRSVLLQCCGASSEVVPDFYVGELSGCENFLLCCDGFRHVISNEEMFEGLNPQVACEKEQMTVNLQYFVDVNKYRQETDNISAILIHVT